MQEAVPILYSDDAVAVCVKPAGLDSQTVLPAAVARRLGGEAFCVHRLDRDVGGVMLCARTRQAAAVLSREIADGLLEKEYLAVCAGRPSPESGELRDLLFHDAGKNKTFVVKRMRRGVKEAALRYAVLASDESKSLVRVRLLTGRSHQIRVQFASRGMPLLGDRKYGGAPLPGGPALWSAALAFPHPDTGETMRFSVPAPMAAPWTDFDH